MIIRARYACIHVCVHSRSLRAQETFPPYATPQSRKQGSFMYTNARETAIYALAVEQRP